MNMQWPRMSHIHIADAQQRVNITYPSRTGQNEKLLKAHRGRQSGGPTRHDEWKLLYSYFIF